MTALCNARLVLQDAVVTGDIVIDSGRIQSVFVPPAPHDCRCIDLCGLYLCPGFIDIHVHGGGHDFMDASLRAFREASAFHLSHGTMTMFPPRPWPVRLMSFLRSSQPSDRQSQCVCPGWRACTSRGHMCHRSRPVPRIRAIFTFPVTAVWRRFWKKEPERSGSEPLPRNCQAPET